MSALLAKTAKNSTFDKCGLQTSLGFLPIPEPIQNKVDATRRPSRPLRQTWWFLLSGDFFGLIVLLEGIGDENEDRAEWSG